MQLIQINLLPYRAERMLQKKQQLQRALLAVLCLAGVLILSGKFYISHQVGLYQERVVQLERDLRKSEQKITLVTKIHKDIDSLLQRKATIERLQNSRNNLVRLLNSVGSVTPEGVYFTKMTQQEAEIIKLEGVSDSEARVAALMRNINDSQWLSMVDLVKVGPLEQPIGSQSSLLQGTRSQKVPIESKPTFILSVRQRVAVSTNADPGAVPSPNPAEVKR